MHGCWSL